MASEIGAGRTEGCATFDQLVSYIEDRPGQELFKISMEGVKLIEASFASEAIVELIRRYLGRKGICLVNLFDPTVRFNIDIAAARVNVPVTGWNDGKIEVIGGEPSSGNRGAFDFALAHHQARAAEFASVASISIANASTKFKQLWEQGFLMRSESAADSGGVEFVYRRVG